MGPGLAGGVPPAGPGAGWGAERHAGLRPHHGYGGQRVWPLWAAVRRGGRPPGPAGHSPVPGGPGLCGGAGGGCTAAVPGRPGGNGRVSGSHRGAAPDGGGGLPGRERGLRPPGPGLGADSRWGGRGVHVPAGRGWRAVPVRHSAAGVGAGDHLRRRAAQRQLLRL